MSDRTAFKAEARTEPNVYLKTRELIGWNTLIIFAQVFRPVTTHSGSSIHLMRDVCRDLTLCDKHLQSGLGAQAVPPSSSLWGWNGSREHPTVNQSIFYSAFILLHFEYAPIYLDPNKAPLIFYQTMDLSSVNPITHDRGATIAQDNLRTRRTSELRTVTVKREREREGYITPHSISFHLQHITHLGMHNSYFQ